MTTTPVTIPATPARAATPAAGTGTGTGTGTAPGTTARATTPAPAPGTTTAQAAANGAVATARTTGIGADFNTFLTLLTTQLKNQDPTKAMSVEQMTGQLVQFAQVEQQVRMNDGLEELIGLQQASQLTAAAPMLGRMVEVRADRLSLQDGAATLRLPAAGAAGTAVVQVQDGGGRVLREARVPLGGAAQDWKWDGRDMAGRRQPDGAYRFTVTGISPTGAELPLQATVRARATGAERNDAGALRLTLGNGLEVGFDRIRSLPGG